MKPTKPESSGSKGRLGAAAGAILLGLPLAASVLVPLHLGWITHHNVVRYLSHYVEQVTLVLACCAVGTLSIKLVGLLSESGAFRRAWLPNWDGKPVAVTEAKSLLAGVHAVAGWLGDTLLVRRVAAVLDFLCQRGSAEDLDDQMRALADNDAMTIDASYGLTRLITWAIPILGFLGTVLGITAAISGVNSEALEKGLSGVTDGLSEAFDATALALSLTMIVMFCSFIIERWEHGILARVDTFVDEKLAHRFIRLGSDSEPFVAAVQQSTKVLLSATNKLVRRQAKIWAKVLDETHERHAEVQTTQQHQLTSALETALANTLRNHAQRLEQSENQTLQHSGQLLDQLAAVAAAVRDVGREQQAGLAQVAQEIKGQAAALGTLQQQEKHLRQMQAALSDNLTALEGAGAFEQAVHSLTAAVHLLTGRVARGLPAPAMTDETAAALKLVVPPNTGPTSRAA